MDSYTHWEQNYRENTDANFSTLRNNVLLLVFVNQNIQQFFKLSKTCMRNFLIRFGIFLRSKCWVCDRTIWRETVRTHFDSQLNNVIDGAVVLGLNKIDYSANEHSLGVVFFSSFFFRQIYLRFIIDNSRLNTEHLWCEITNTLNAQPCSCTIYMCVH